MPAYSDEYLLSLAHLGPAVVGPQLRTAIEACQARTKALDSSSTVLGPAILGSANTQSDDPKKSRAKKAA